MRSVAIAIVLAGCGHARIVEQTQVGGTLELSGDRGKAMEQANRKMAEQCGVANSTITYSGDEHGAYRVHYQCNGAVP